MGKVRLDKFLMDRIPEGWIDRLFPEGYEVEKRRGRGSRIPPRPFIGSPLCKNSLLE